MSLLVLGACDGPETVSEDACRLRMVDRVNGTSPLLQVIRLDPSVFVVTDRLTSATPWSVEVRVATDGQLTFVTASVPRVSKADVVSEYAARTEDWLTFQSVEGYPCDDFERALVYFLVMEWFYFG